jgi:hypothetical protein
MGEPRIALRDTPPGPANTYPITALLPKKRHGKARGVKFSITK